MEPNLLIGDRLFVSKYSFGYSKHSFPFSPPIFKGRVLSKIPKRGDVIVFKTPSDNRTDYIKRLIGLPGDKIKFIGFVNNALSLINVYDNHNILILPSFTEAHPKVLDESLARLRPVIIFEEISHIIQNRKGIFVSKRNVQSFSKTIEFVISNYLNIQEDMRKNKLPTKREFFLQMAKILG